MSLNAITWAFRQHETSPTQRLVLLAMANYANEDNGARPSRALIEEMTGLSRATVFRAVSDLKKAGVIRDAVVDGREGWELAITPFGESQSETRESQSETAQSQSETRSILGTQEEPKRTGSPVGSKDVERVWNHYCSMPGKRVRPLPEQERKVILAALKVATADELVICINECWKSDFHMKRREHQDRPGQRYDKLTQIIKGRQGKETTRERIDFWLERAETTGVAGSGVPSADPAVIARRKQDVQRGHRLAGDPQAVRKAQEAEAWLRKCGIVTIRGEDGYPSFQDASLMGV